jgi:hypothetical protein
MWGSGDVEVAGVQEDGVGEQGMNVQQGEPEGDCGWSPTEK